MVPSPARPPRIYGERPADPVCSSFLVAGLQALLHTGNLDIVSLVSLIHHKVNLQLLANTFALFILIEDIHDTHINIGARVMKPALMNTLFFSLRL